MEAAIISMLMWIVVLAPIWLYLGLQAAIRFAKRFHLLDGWLADVDRLVNQEPVVRRELRPVVVEHDDARRRRPQKASRH